MTLHELARKLFGMPDCQMTASIDAAEITSNDDDNESHAIYSSN